MAWMDAEGLTSSDTPNVSAQENAGNPHYHPSREAHRAIRPNEVLLLDLWGKLRHPGAVFADITWVGFTGSTVPDEYARAFAAARDGRDAAVDLVQSAARAGRELRGFEVDRSCRAVVEKAGYGAEFIHRTGHSLGETVHGNGVHLDDYETHDDRRLIPGTGFTIEPGVYTSTFGVRTEINMFMDKRDAYVSGPRAVGHPAVRIEGPGYCFGDQQDDDPKDDGFLWGSDSHRVDCRGDGDRVAVGPDAGLVGADHQRAGREHGGAERSHRRADVPQHRQGAEPDGRQHPDDGALARAGADRVLRRPGRPAAALLRAGSGAGAGPAGTRAGSAPTAKCRRRKAPERASSSTSPASFSRTTTSSKAPTTSASACSAADGPRATRRR